MLDDVENWGRLAGLISEMPDEWINSHVTIQDMNNEIFMATVSGTDLADPNRFLLLTPIADDSKALKWKELLPIIENMGMEEKCAPVTLKFNDCYICNLKMMRAKDDDRLDEGHPFLASPIGDWEIGEWDKSYRDLFTSILDSAKKDVVAGWEYVIDDGCEDDTNFVVYVDQYAFAPAVKAYILGYLMCCEHHNINI